MGWYVKISELSIMLKGIRNDRIIYLLGNPLLKNPLQKKTTQAHQPWTTLCTPSRKRCKPLPLLHPQALIWSHVCYMAEVQRPRDQLGTTYFRAVQQKCNRLLRSFLLVPFSVPCYLPKMKTSQ